MDDQSSRAPSLTRNHLLVTREFFVRGMLRPLRGRLADHLKASSRSWITVEQAEIFFHVDDDRQEFGRLHIPRHEVLFAHEYVDLGSDPHLRTTRTPEETLNVVAILGELSLRGRLSARAVDQDAPFLTLLEPDFLTADAGSAARVAPLRGLPWVLVNRDRISVLLEDERS